METRHAPRVAAAAERRGWWAALAGAAAAGAALGVAEVVSVFTGARSAPLVAVGGVVVDKVPEPLKQLAIDLFGGYDKIVLLTGTLVLLVGFAALLGVLALRSWRYAAIGVAVFAAIGVAAALTRPGAGPTAALPSLVGAAGTAVVLWFLLGRVAPGGVPGGRVGDEPGRRRFLWTVGAVAVGSVAAGAAGRLLAVGRGVRESRAAVVLPAAAGPAPEVPTGADLGLPGLAPYVTPNRQFYRIDTALVVPQVDPETWRLRIHGRVGRPVTLTFADLLRRPMVERYVTLACVSNEVGGDLIGNARWLGVPVKELLDEVLPEPGADQVVGRSADGWTCGTPTAILRDGRDALLAVGMNGAPLPVEHGFPVRMVVPGLYGYVSACKWIVELELTSFDEFDAYWVPRGWAAQGPIKTQSRIDTPRAGARIDPGPVAVAGVAWAQHRGVTGVEVRVDGGPWQPATLADTVSTDTWRQWYLRWDATPGEHTLTVRATDPSGTPQTPVRQSVAPDGATGHHTVRVRVG